MQATKRSIVVAAATSLTGLGGCLDSSIGRTGGTASTEVVDTDFATGVETDKDMADDPAVRHEDSKIVATGTYAVGNYCYEAHMPDPSFDEDADRLEIDVTREHNGSDECEDIMQTVSYRAIVTIEGPPPKTVHVSETEGGETTVDL